MTSFQKTERYWIGIRENYDIYGMILTKNSIPIAFLSLAIALMSFEVRKIPDEPPSLLLNSACKPGTKGEIKDSSPQKTTQREAIAKEMEEVLTSSIMDLWYSRCLDKEYGG
ncbi:MAG: hypothetical protein KAH12_05595 [Anaerolineales bacterium]|nr:hypothetical protein [Anaerolineales bacterium]